MATLRVWAGFHECADVDSLHAIAGALKEATDAAHEAGCKHEIVMEDIGDQQIGVSGPVTAVAAAAGEYKERGFDPEVSASSEEEFAALDGLLPGEVGMELEG